MLIHQASQRQSSYERTADDNAKYYADRARRDLQRCVTFSLDERAQCEAEANEARRQGQRDEHDLEAQRVTAAWTSFMGIAAIIGMAVSIVGVGLVFTTFRESKRSADAAQRTLSAFIAVERGRLAVSGSRATADPSEPGYASVEIKVRNYGNTPVHIFQFNFEQIADTKFPGQMARSMSARLTVGQSEEAQIVSGYVKISDLDNLPYYACCVSYSSTFGTIHESHFLAKVHQLKMGNAIINPPMFVTDEERRHKYEDWPDE